MDRLQLDRAEGALFGLALGDAMGMPSQTLARDEIARRYGRITRFVAPFADHPVAHGLDAGQVTDDTEQALLLARRLVAEPDRFDPRGWAEDLLAWERDVAARGLRDLLGPSSKAALAALLDGASPEETGRTGTTNGAAMRIAPVGIAVPARPEAIADAVTQTCRVTHNTGEAIAAASAVAMTVSLGVEGRSFAETLEGAIAAAAAGQGRGHPVGERDMAGRIRLALEAAERGGEAALASEIGTSVASRCSVPVAFGLLQSAGGDTLSAVRMAANIGDDTDTIGAIAGAMGGACAGLSRLPVDMIGALTAANDLKLGPLVRDLLSLRATESAAEATE